MPTQSEFAEAIKAVMKRASADAEFRKLCLEDAEAAVREASGIELPAGVKIQFAEELEEQVFLLPPLGDGELSDEELENVSGGNQFTTYLVCCPSVDPCYTGIPDGC